VQLLALELQIVCSTAGTAVLIQALTLLLQHFQGV
jgi:hypothetical protein